MVFDYNGNGDATAACIFNRSQTYVTASSTCSGAALKTGYGYTTISSKVYLTSATDVLGNTTTYTQRSEEHTSELQSLMRISYAVFCLEKKNTTKTQQ